MKISAIVLTSLLLLLLSSADAPAEEPAASKWPSPVGHWKLDKDAVEPGISDTADELLKSLAIPDMELRILEGGRYEAVVELAGLDAEGRLELGTWTQSRDVVSLASLRDDGQPASLIGRLTDDALVIDLGGMELPFRRVEDPSAPAPAPAEQEDEKGAIGIGPGPSIRMPRVERDDGSWPPVAITAVNHRRVAKRTGTEVVAAVAAERKIPVDELWRDVPATRVIHIQSAFDRIEPILDAWGIPHTSLTPLAFLESGTADLAEARVVIAPSLASLPRALEASLAHALRTFVADGGLLVTTDWSVESILQPAFPELVATAGRRAPMDEMTCVARVTPAAQSAPSLIRGLPLQSEILLWCEASSFDVQPVQGAATQTLLAADHRRARTLVFAASHGKGRILHLLPQLRQQRGSPTGAHVLQRIVLNAVAAALE